MTIEVSQHGSDSNTSIVGSLGANTSLVGLDRLPGGVAVVGALVHVHALETLGRAPEVEIDAPESGTEGIGKTRGTFVVQGVSLAYYVWNSEVS